MTAPTSQTLRQCPLFGAVDDQGIEALGAVAQICRFAAGQRIFNEGEPCPGLFIVADGQVRIYKTNSDGKTHVLHMASPGQTFAEVAVLGGFELPASAEAVLDTTCVLLPKLALIETLKKHHELSLQMMQGMAFWVRTLVTQLEGMTLRDAKGRVAKFLLDKTSEGTPRLKLDLSNRDLASHLNLTSETLSRTMRQLEEDGIIHRPSVRDICVLNRQALRYIAGAM